MKVNGTQANPIFNSRRRRWRAQFAALTSLALFAAVSTSVGCKSASSFFGDRQLQNENTRLLSEFRTQKNRADQLASRNQQLESRLGESEKMVAQMFPGKPLGRLSSNTQRPQNYQLGSRSIDPKSLPNNSISTGEMELSNGQWKVRGQSQTVNQ